MTWGPWIPHDGRHLPPEGAIVQATFDDDMTLTGLVRHDDQTHREAFLWMGGPEVSHVIRYRKIAHGNQAASHQIKEAIG